MPLYEYRCTQQDHTFEVFNSIEERNFALCPKHNTPGIRIEVTRVSLGGRTDPKAGDIRRELFGSSGSPSFKEIKSLTKRVVDQSEAALRKVKGR